MQVRYVLAAAVVVLVHNSLADPHPAPTTERLRELPIDNLGACYAARSGVVGDAWPCRASRRRAIVLTLRISGPVPVPKPRASGEPDSTMLADSARVATPVVFALRLVENPARGRIRLAVGLPSREGARLDVFDVAGRRVGGRDFEAGAPRRLSIDLTEGGKIPAGVYWLRLAQGVRTATSHVVLLK
jgi:hypothetical protein